MDRADKKQKRFVYYVFFLGIVSLISSLYLYKVYHLGLAGGSVEHSFCNLTSVVNCEKVNLSPYAKIFNTPVSVLGIIWSIGLFLIAFLGLKGRRIGFDLFLYSGIGVLVSLYFIYLESFVLFAVCIPCSIVHLSTVMVFLGSIFMMDRKISSYFRGKLLARPGTVMLILVGVSTFATFLGYNMKSSYKEYKRPLSLDMTPVEGSQLDRFAQCLTEKGVRFYGSSTCPVCLRSKQLFGLSFRYINSVECNPRHPANDAALCGLRQITAYPTWIIEKDGKEIKRQVGYQSIDDLSNFSGCEQ